MSEEKLNELKEKVANLQEELKELTPEELEKVNGGLFVAGFIGSPQMGCVKDASATAIYGTRGAN